MQWVEEWIDEKEVETSVDPRNLAIQIMWGVRGSDSQREVQGGRRGSFTVVCLFVCLF